MLEYLRSFTRDHRDMTYWPYFMARRHVFAKGVAGGAGGGGGREGV